MRHWSKNYETMRLTAFRLDDVEADERGGFRYRHGFRAALARLRAGLSRTWPRPDPDNFRRPPNNWA